MIEGERQDEGILEDWFMVQCPDIRFDGEECRIESTSFDGMDEALGLVFEPSKREAREGAAKDGIEVGEEIGGDGRDHADSKDADEGIRVEPGCGDEVLERGEHGSASLDQSPSGSGQAHFSTIPLKKLNPQCPLEFRHLGAQGRLGDMTTLGGLPEIEFFSDRDHVLKLAERDRICIEFHWDPIIFRKTWTWSHPAWTPWTRSSRAGSAAASRGTGSRFVVARVSLCVVFVAARGPL